MVLAAAAAANIAAQMSNWKPATMATVSVPTGFIVNIVQPALIYGTLYECQRVAQGLADPGV